MLNSQHRNELLHRDAYVTSLYLCELHTYVDSTLQWRHSEHDGVSNHRRLDCLFNRLFRRRSKKTTKLRVTGLCEGNSAVTGDFPAQRASNAENVSVHDVIKSQQNHPNDLFAPSTNRKYPSIRISIWVINSTPLIIWYKIIKKRKEIIVVVTRTMWQIVKSIPYNTTPTKQEYVAVTAYGRHGV